MPNKANLQIYQGDTYAAKVTVYGAGDNLAGFTCQSQIRCKPADSDPVVICEIQTAIVTGKPEIILTIPAEETEYLSGQYCWDLQLTDSAGQRTTILAGYAVVTPEVTRDERDDTTSTKLLRQSRAGYAA